MPEPRWISGAISGGAGLIGSAINYFSQQEANEANLRLARENRDFYQQQWQRENLYNSPSAQMQRLSTAGLNPSLMYGEGSGGLPDAATMANVEAGRVAAPQVDPLMLAQIANINADTEKKKAETSTSYVQSDYLRGQIKVGDSVVYYNNKLADLSDAQRRYTEGQLLQLDTLTQEAQSRIDLNRATIDNMTVQQQQRFMDLELRSKEVDAACAKMAAETDYTLEQTKYIAGLALAKIYNLRTDSVLKYYESRLTQEQINQCHQATNGLILSNGKLSWDISQDKKFAPLERQIAINKSISDILKNQSDASQSQFGPFHHRYYDNDDWLGLPSIGPQGKF